MSLKWRFVSWESWLTCLLKRKAPEPVSASLRTGRGNPLRVAGDLEEWSFKYEGHCLILRKILYHSYRLFPEHENVYIARGSIYQNTNTQRAFALKLENRLKCWTSCDWRKPSIPYYRMLWNRSRYTRLAFAHILFPAFLNLSIQGKKK